MKSAQYTEGGGGVSFPSGAVVKNPLANAETTGHSGSISGLGRSRGVGNGNPFQYSCLENSMNTGAWRATVHGVAKRQTQLNPRAHTGDNPIHSSYNSEHSESKPVSTSLPALGALPGQVGQV